MTVALDTRTDDLTEWARSFVELAGVAVTLARTPFVPNSLRAFQRAGGALDEETTAAQVTAAILTGRELGVAPMASLRSIDVINGTPALRALTMRALVLRAGHDMWLVERTTVNRAVMAGKRRDSSHVIEVVWDTDRARRLGLINKPNWRAQPDVMLEARCTAQLARLIAPEELLGLPYSAEEVGEGYEVETEPAPEQEPEPPKRRRRRKPVDETPMAQGDSSTDGAGTVSTDKPPAVPAPQPRRAVPFDEPPLDPSERRELVDVPLPYPENERPPAITAGQRSAIFAAIHGIGVHDRDDRLAMVTALIKRQVASFNELTFSEAEHVLAELGLIAAQESEEEPPTDDLAEDE